MRENDLIRLSEDIIRHYCRKDLSLFFKYIDDNLIAVGPRQGQIIRSKDSMEAVWVDPGPRIDFRLSDVEAAVISAGPRNWEVLLQYLIRGELPGGRVFSQPQRAQFSWVLKQKQYRLRVIHISNPAALDERDLVHNAWGDIEGAKHILGSSGMDDAAGTYITLRGQDRSLYRYLSSSLMWIESADEGRHTRVHARDQVIPCLEKLSYFEEACPGIFLRPHVSYLVNPHYIKSLRRFELSLWDGTRLSVPEKKYTALKNRLQQT